MRGGAAPSRDGGSCVAGAPTAPRTPGRVGASVCLREEGAEVVLGDQPERLEHAEHELGAVDAVAVAIERHEQLLVQLLVQHLGLLLLLSTRGEGGGA